METVVPLPSSLSIPTSPPDWWAKPKIWLRPRPVPLPTGLVVKKGSKARSRTSAVIPQPVSETLIFTYSPAWMSPTAFAAIVTFSVAMRIAPWPSIASRALTARFTIAFSSWWGSTKIGHALDQIRAVDPLGEQRLGTGEGEQPPSQCGSARGAFHRILQVIEHLS